MTTRWCDDRPNRGVVHILRPVVCPRQVTQSGSRAEAKQNKAYCSLGALSAGASGELLQPAAMAGSGMVDLPPPCQFWSRTSSMPFQGKYVALAVLPRSDMEEVFGRSWYGGGRLTTHLPAIATRCNNINFTQKSCRRVFGMLGVNSSRGSVHCCCDSDAL